MKPKFSRAASYALSAITFLTLAAGSRLQAQQSAIQSPTPQATASPQGAATVATPLETGLAADNSRDERYRIGPGDLLDIRVFNKAQFSRDGVRVDSRGMIRMPFIEGEIKAACRTEAELATE